MYHSLPYSQTPVDSPKKQRQTTEYSGSATKVNLSFPPSFLKGHYRGDEGKAGFWHTGSLSYLPTENNSRKPNNCY